MVRYELKIEGYRFRVVEPHDLILPEDHNHKVYVLRVFCDKIDKIIAKLEEYWCR